MNNFNNQKQKPRPVAIKVEGKLKNSKITDNITVGMELLEADEIEDSSIERNKTFSSNDFSSIKKVEIIGRDKIEQHGDGSKASIGDKRLKKEGFWSQIFWKFIIPTLVIMVAAVLIWYFGIK